MSYFKTTIQPTIEWFEKHHLEVKRFVCTTFQNSKGIFSALGLCLHFLYLTVITVEVFWLLVTQY